MWKYVIWLIFIQLCSSENVDYSDYHPKNIPLQNSMRLPYQNPSSEYKAVMENLYDSWESPITYLQKRGYMPAKDQDKVDIQVKPNQEKKVKKEGNKSELLLREEEDKDEDAVAANAGPDVPAAPSNSSKVNEGTSNDTSGIITKVRDKFLSIFARNSNVDDHKTEKIKLSDWNEDIFDPEFQDYANDYDSIDRRIFTRSATDKPTAKPTYDDIFSNLSDTEISFIKIFINCFKQNKKDFVLQSISTSQPDVSVKADDTKNTTLIPSDSKSNDTKPAGPKPPEGKSGDVKGVDSKPVDAKQGDNSQAKTGQAKTDDTKAKPGDTKPGETTTTTAKPGDTKTADPKLSETKPNGGTKPSNTTATNATTANPLGQTTTPECIPVDNFLNYVKTTVPSASTTPDCIPLEQLRTTKGPILAGNVTGSGSVAGNGTSTGNSTTTTTTSKPLTSGGKNASNDFTVDLDINQKNGTGQGIYLNQTDPCPPIPIISSTSKPSEIPNKYFLISAFLAHLHHQVDEVGKAPRKRLNLKHVEEVIKNSKHTSTVTMGDGKTTELAPLRLNDMTFDLEWNKIDKFPANEGKYKSRDYVALNQPDGESLASKFLQEARAYSQANARQIDTPFGDNFLDEQQSTSDDIDMPNKPSTKREAVLPNSAGHSRKLSNLLSDIASMPNSDNEEDYYVDDVDESSDSLRRRIKGRLRNGGRKNKKAKFRPNERKNTFGEGDSFEDLYDNDKETNDFNSFDELKDIQFRVSDDDEEAISKFISNLNAPPEIFSFDVDKYLRSVETKEEPEGFDFEYQSPEHRTYYEFMEAPAVEKERLPIIDAPEIDFREQLLRKDDRGRSAGVKRDLLRQYIKGVSNALSHNIPDLTLENTRMIEEKPERSPPIDNDITFRTKDLIADFSTNLDAMNYIKSNNADDFLDKYFLLNDGSSQMSEIPKNNVDLAPSDKFSPQSLEIDLDLNKKFRDLGIGTYNTYSRFNGDNEDEINDEDTAEVSRRKIEAEVENDQY